VVGIATGDQEPSESFSHTGGPRFRSVLVEVTQRLTDTAAVIYRSG
jgi:hypothetical protein